MKKLIIPDSINQLKKCIKYVDACLIGINNMSVNVPVLIDFPEISKIKRIIKEKDLFICLNKNMTNSDISNLKNILIKLNDYNIKGIFYADVSIVNLSNHLDLNYDLVWANEQVTTSYYSINYWYDFNVNYTYISSSITLEEIIDIKNNTKCKLIVPIFGYLPMFVSKRHIVKNYLNHFSLKDNSKINFIEKENKIYPIIDNELGTTVYYSDILDGLEEMKILEKSNIDYVTLNGFNIIDEDFIKVLKIYNGELSLKPKNIFSNIDTCFLHKKTVSRVKK